MEDEICDNIFLRVFKLPLTFEIETLLLLFADPVVVDVEVGDGELDDVLYGNGAEIMRMDNGWVYRNHLLHTGLFFG